MRRREAHEVLGRLVDVKTARLPYARAGRVEGRHTDGTLRLTFLEGACEARLGLSAGGRAARKGEVVLAEPSGASSRGTAGVPVARLAASRSSLWIERLERLEIGDAEALDELLAGETVTVTVHGRGFTPTTAFEFLLPETLGTHPHVAQLGQRFLDSERVEIDLEIHADAAELDEAPLAAQDASLRTVKPDAYRITRPAEKPFFEGLGCGGANNGEPLLALLHGLPAGPGQPHSSTLFVGDTTGRFDLANPLGTVDWNDVVGEITTFIHLGGRNEHVSANALLRSQQQATRTSGGVGTLRVWDWMSEGAPLYRYDAPGRRIAGPSLFEGWLWWVEYDAPFGNPELKRARTDLTDVETVAPANNFQTSYQDFFAFPDGTMAATWFRTDSKPTTADVFPPGETLFTEVWPVESLNQTSQTRDSPGVALPQGSWRYNSRVFGEGSDVGAGTFLRLDRTARVLREEISWPQAPLETDIGGVSFFSDPGARTHFFHDGRALVAPMFNTIGSLVLIADPLFTGKIADSFHVGDCFGIDPFFHEIFPAWPAFL